MPSDAPLDDPIREQVQPHCCMCVCGCRWACCVKDIYGVNLDPMLCMRCVRGCPA